MNARRIDIPWLLEWILCLALATVFFAAAIPKIGNPSAFALSVHQYGIVPQLFVNAAAIYLPWLEISCAAALAFIPSARRGALWTAIAMLAVFAIALGATVVRGEVVSCGCFGGGGEPSSGWPGLLRNAGLIVLAAAGLKTLRR
jgi:hypothetical protein